MPFGAVEKPLSERDLRAHKEASPSLGAPAAPKVGSRRPGTTPAWTLLLQSSPAPAPGGPRRLGAFSAWSRQAQSEKGPPATGNRAVRRGCPTPAFCPNRSQSGQNARENWQENAQRTRRTSARTPRGLIRHREGSSPNPARKPSGNQAPARPMPPGPQPRAVPSLPLSHGPWPAPGRARSLACFLSFPFPGSCPSGPPTGEP